MHPTQQKILDLSIKHNIDDLSYRRIGDILGGKNPQTIKYHIIQLEKKSLLKKNKPFEFLTSLKSHLKSQIKFIEIPVLGEADCGIATVIAEQRVEMFLKVSERIIGRKKTIFALKARGDSMNLSSINNKSIEEGDYVLIDYNDRNPMNGDYIVSIINDCANIKMYLFREKLKQIHLISKSKTDYPPIVIDSRENFFISGKVIDVIKYKV